MVGGETHIILKTAILSVDFLDLTSYGTSSIMWQLSVFPIQLSSFSFNSYFKLLSLSSEFLSYEKNF